MSMYINIGGGAKQLASLYINKDGTRKSITNAYANINASSKIIFTKLYTWAKYTWSTDGNKNYSSSIQYGSSHTKNNFTDYTLYLYKSISVTSSGLWHHSNKVTVNITFPSISPTVTISIGSDSISYYTNGSNSGWRGSVSGLSGSGNNLKFSGFYGYGNYYASIGKDEFDSSTSSRFDSLYFDGFATGDVNYIDAYYTEIYAPTCRYSWKRNPVEYVTSNNINAYTENNTDINVNSDYYYSDSSYFPYNPTYRFIG